MSSTIKRMFFFCVKNNSATKIDGTEPAKPFTERCCEVSKFLKISLPKFFFKSSGSRVWLIFFKFISFQHSAFSCLQKTDCKQRNDIIKRQKRFRGSPKSLILSKSTILNFEKFQNLDFNQFFCEFNILFLTKFLTHENTYLSFIHLSDDKRWRL